MCQPFERRLARYSIEAEPWGDDPHDSASLPTEQELEDALEADELEGYQQHLDHIEHLGRDYQ